MLGTILMCVGVFVAIWFLAVRYDRQDDGSPNFAIAFIYAVACVLVVIGARL